MMYAAFFGKDIASAAGFLLCRQMSDFEMIEANIFFRMLYFF